MSPKKVIVSFSGGVDSSIALLLLKQQAYDVTAVFMKNWEDDDDDDFCNAEQDIKDAETICENLNTPLKKVNFSTEYWDHVFSHFLKIYQLGQTPNPDVMCNKKIKFETFLHYSKKLGGDFIATGHYVRKRILKNGECQLLKGIDPNKDQSYFLYMLNQKQLKLSLFPIGKFIKPDVRAIAKKYGLITHNKKDSTGICFIGERKLRVFLKRYLPQKHGEIHNEQGRIIGKHDGLMYYTIGQRKGLGIGGKRDASEEPWFVINKDIRNNRLIVVQGQNHPMLFKRTLKATNLNWISGRLSKNPLYCYAKIRYRQTDQICTVITNNNKSVIVNFQIPQRAVTPGQSIVFYNHEVCLGGGIIV